MNQKSETGNQGETIAAQYLEAKGYQIIERNWHCRFGELDIVAKSDEILLFCEVKTVHDKSTENAFANMTEPKLRKLVKAIYHYLAAHGQDDTLWRLDLIAIALPAKANPVIEHVEDALDW